MILTVLQSSCTFGDEPGVCPYNTRLDYWYAGSGSENQLPVYVDNLRQYLFDSEGELLGVEPLRGDSIRGWQGNRRVNIRSSSGATWRTTAVTAWL